jgi:hypothetical protein
MATLFCDYVDGNDLYGGDSFAVTATGTDMGTNGTGAVTSASAAFTGALIGRYISVCNGATLLGTYVISAVPSGTSLTLVAISGGNGTASLTTGTNRTYYIGGRWKTLTTGASAARLLPGDTVRLKASPYPTSLGVTGAWTNGPIGASKTITGATNASPIVITSASHGLSNGMYVVVSGILGNTAANGVFKIQNVATNTLELVGSTGNGAYSSGGTFFDCSCMIVELSAALTQNIDVCDVAWTPSANVTVAVDTTAHKQGCKASNIVIAAGFTTGLAAYKATGTLDLSGYQQVSFWVRSSVILTAGVLSLRLCSDTAGVTTVNTIAIPAIPVANFWQCVTVDLAGALGASIQSVALYADSDPGAVSILLDNIIACKASSAADSLTLSSLIGKNTANETWYPIQSINGTIVKLDCGSATLTNAGRGYTGATETVTTYKRECVLTTPVASGSTLESFTESGVAGSVSLYSGGWNRTDMSTQDGETWFNGQNGGGNAFSLTNRSFITIEKISAVRYVTGFGGNTPTFYTIRDCHLNGNGNYGFSVNPNVFGTIEDCWFVANSVAGAVLRGAAEVTISNCRIDGNVTNGNGAVLVLSGHRNLLLDGCLLRNNNQAAVSGGGNAATNDTSLFRMRNCTTENNSAAAIYLAPGDCEVKDCQFGEAVPILHHISIGVGRFSNNRGVIINHNNVLGDQRIYADGGTILSESTVRHTASGIAWKMSPTSADRSSVYPLDFKLTPIGVAANALVTVSVWLRRTNTALTGMLVVRGGQLAGVPNDVSAAMTAAADTWEEVSLSFTPTEAGTIEVEVWAYGGTTYSLYVDDFNPTQA